MQISYIENNGTVLPGYTQKIGFLGTANPGIAFALGRQEDIRFEAAKRGWLTEFPNFNQAYATVHNNEVTYNAEIGFVSEAYPSRESQSLYGQATVNIDDANRAIFGFRYTEDEFSSNVTNFFGLQQYLIQDELDETTGRIAYERDLDEDTMVYVSYTKGFKPGGSNLTFGWPVDDEREFGALPAPQLVFPFFQSEMIDAFEV